MPSKSRQPKSTAINSSAAVRPARAFRTGGSLAVRIPKDFQLPESDLMITKVQDGLLITAAPGIRSVADWWATWEADPAFMADGRQQPATQVRDFGN